jgi:hypothetical protein
METYLQKAWGDSLDNVTTKDIKTAIYEIQKMDDEHGAFWVGLVKTDENVLEVSKDLGVIAKFEDEDKEYKGQGKNWEEIESLFENFLLDRMDLIKSRLKMGDK